MEMQRQRELRRVTDAPSPRSRSWRWRPCRRSVQNGGDGGEIGKRDRVFLILAQRAPPPLATESPDPPIDHPPPPQISPAIVANQHPEHHRRVLRPPNAASTRSEPMIPVDRDPPTATSDLFDRRPQNPVTTFGHRFRQITTIQHPRHHLLPRLRPPSIQSRTPRFLRSPPPPSAVATPTATNSSTIFPNLKPTVCRAHPASILRRSGTLPPLPHLPQRVLVIVTKFKTQTCTCHVYATKPISIVRPPLSHMTCNAKI